MRLIILLLILVVLVFKGKSQIQNIDTTYVKNHSSMKYEYLAVPAAMVWYGVVGVKNKHLQRINNRLNWSLEDNVVSKFTIDDYTQYVPAASVYALNFTGLKGKHNFVDRTIIFGTAYAIMGAVVLTSKQLIDVERPDNSAFNSFPSGHTATAFMGAEFLYQEYKDHSPLFGVSGYIIAAGTGFLRMYNRRHWLTDVLAGAGVGILSTKLAYYLHPKIKRLYHKSDNKCFAYALPYYDGKAVGLGLSLTF